MQQQKRRDQRIDDLAKAMCDTYVVVQEADPLKERASLKDVIIALSRQTTECAYFIQKYATDKRFCEFLANLNADAKSD
jgi:hypothetical protein